MTLEELQPGACIRGIVPDTTVTVVSVQWHGADALTLVYRTPEGRVADQLLFRADEAKLDLVTSDRPWSFDGDGARFRLVAEAHRIRLAHLFDPLLAVHTSLVEPLPHQITAVYQAMLPRQPLRFLLADDPGAGKTIMAGLLIKELIVRGDLQRCLIVCPGNLVEQWQDELHQRFHLPFEILTSDKLEAARTGNWFLENDLVIARLDKLARDDAVQQKLAVPECRWDLIVCDEAHKLSATFFGGEVKYTKRYRLGRLLSGLTRHFLLLTATPHNGKEEDFQLFLALLDGDRFEGRFRDGVHQVDVSDLMRRMVKERLLKFDGRPLFPERMAYTVPYKLSDAEARLYKEVTDYVREEWNRAEALQNDKQAGTVGFALSILQRRLASSPEAIYQSLRRRRERLEKRLRELELLQRGAAPPPPTPLPAAHESDTPQSSEGRPEARTTGEGRLEACTPGAGACCGAAFQAARRPELGTTRECRPEACTTGAWTHPALDAEDIEDLEEAPEGEIEAAEEEILDQATAAATLAELRAEIATLQRLEALAAQVRRSGQDTKWRELSRLLEEIFTPAGLGSRLSEDAPPYGAGPIPKPVPSPHQKLVIFTEHRDTLRYLAERISTLLGRPQALVTIHGGMGREERRKAQEQFLHDPEVQVLVATDAAGEGINLQRAHLMVNYDLPWNPNRIEQRFGRIHRIGQTEVCHLWNLVADETREGDVYHRLLEKLEEARRALGGQVFDVLGKLQFDGRPLRDLLIEAIRYGDQPEVRARLTRAIESGVDRQRLADLLEERALAHDVMDATRVARVREEMERAAARRLQPHYIESFFLEAFKRLGGTIRQREPRRYQITHVPAVVRNRDRQNGRGEPVLTRYERITFEKELIAPPGQPLAAFVCPGHPLLDAVLDLTLERHRDQLKRGAVLVDERDPGTQPRVLFLLEHALQDASRLPSGERRVISRRLLYVEMTPPTAVQPSSSLEGRTTAAGSLEGCTTAAGSLEGCTTGEGSRCGAGLWPAPVQANPCGAGFQPVSTPSSQCGAGLRPAGNQCSQDGCTTGGSSPEGCTTPSKQLGVCGAGFQPAESQGSRDGCTTGGSSPEGCTKEQSSTCGAGLWPASGLEGCTTASSSPCGAGLRPAGSQEGRTTPVGAITAIHYAPYLDYRPLAPDEPSPADILARPECAWITRDLEQTALSHAVAHIVPEHLAEVRNRRLAWIEKTRAAVKDRLTKEIAYWDHRAEELKLREQAGQPAARLNSAEARRRADELAARLQKRMAELDREAQVSALPPVVLGGLVVVPAGLLAQVRGRAVPTAPQDTLAAAARARAIVMETERALGYEPTDRETEKLGYDIESRDPRTGRLRFIEVKGRVAGAATLTVTRNEILTSLNKPDDYLLAIVEFLDSGGHRVHYVRRPFRREPDFGVTSVNYNFAELLTRATSPA